MTARAHACPRRRNEFDFLLTALMATVHLDTASRTNKMMLAYSLKGHVAFPKKMPQLNWFSVTKGQVKAKLPLRHFATHMLVLGSKKKRFLCHTGTKLQLTANWHTRVSKNCLHSASRQRDAIHFNQRNFTCNFRNKKPKIKKFKIKKYTCTKTRVHFFTNVGYPIGRAKSKRILLIH